MKSWFETDVAHLASRPTSIRKYFPLSASAVKNLSYCNKAKHSRKSQKRKCMLDGRGTIFVGFGFLPKINNNSFSS